MFEKTIRVLRGGSGITRRYKEEQAARLCARRCVRIPPRIAWYGMALRSGRHSGAAKPSKPGRNRRPSQPMNSPASHDERMVHHALGHAAVVKRFIAPIERFDPRMTTRLKRGTGYLAG
jgi:hypothetical protein